ncbi:MAG: tryptophan--tRNA ligase, partial [Deltaproteobacteria bacterium]
MAEKKLRLFSAMQPTGELHIGNYLGALRKWVELSHIHEGIYGIVDYHAMTVPYDPSEMRTRTENVAIGYIACGIDPEASIVFVQSHVPEHTELAWIFNTLTPLGMLERMTQFKEKAARGVSVNVGLLDYPVLQAADILLYKATGVPVGEDQVQHLELTREIARKFNKAFGTTFPEPETILSPTPRVLGLDGKNKMSKTLDNHIALADPPEVIWKKLSTRGVTDTRRARRT